jgi:hypothetical protein
MPRKNSVPTRRDNINYSDIPELTEEQLSQFRKPPADFFKRKKGVFVAVPLEKRLLKALQARASKLKTECEDLISSVLRAYIKAK